MASQASQYVIEVVGKIADKEFQHARVLAQYAANNNSLVTANVTALVESDWESFVRRESKAYGGKAFGHRVSPWITVNNEYIGRTPEFSAWLSQTLNIASKGNAVLYTRMANKEYKSYIDTNKNPHVYLDVRIGDAEPERVVIELFASSCPKTCENFRALCSGERGSGLHYKGTPFHRVVKGGWIQGGDIDGGSGTGGKSVFGDTFADESFDVKHDQAGIVAMASDGSAHTNGSQFYITLNPLPFLDGKRVAFGRVVSGMRTLHVVESLPCENQRPTVEVTIAGSGDYDSKQYSSTGASDSKESGGSDRAVRDALYTRLYNIVNAAGSDSVAGDALADGVASRGALFKRLFTEPGVAQLDAALRKAKELTFDDFAALADSIYVDANRVAVKLSIKNPYKSDTRADEDKAKYMDLRRPATKKKLLRTIFDSLDTSEDGYVDRKELLAGLRGSDSLLKKHFPKHFTEIPSWLEASKSDAKLSFDEFSAVAVKALSRPGGREQ